MNILSFVESIPNHRQEVKVLHLSTDIIFITVAAVICGAEDWEDVQYFGRCKEKFFRKYLSLPNGIPSHDTFNRFFSHIDPVVMEQQFRLWVKAICSHDSHLVPIDGKTICGVKSALMRWAVSKTLQCRSLTVRPTICWLSRRINLNFIKQ